MSGRLQNLAPIEIMRKLRSLKRELLALPGSKVPKRIAVLGGSTTSAVRDALEVYLLDCGIEPTFYESDYNKYYEDAVFPNAALASFKPEIVYLHTSSANLKEFPSVHASAQGVEQMIEHEIGQWKKIWNALRESYAAIVIQNNFDYLPYRDLGNLDAVDPRGRNAYILRLNQRMAEEALATSGVVIQDIHFLSASVGLSAWHDPQHWYAYKYSLSHTAIPMLAHNLARLIVAASGKSKKVLVLDLDNTLWGGVIGDDGVPNLKLGHETPQGEAHIALQEYVRRLSDRGVVLAVASKNDHKIAKTGFDHPDSVLKFEDFGSFKANWMPKSLSLQEIAHELNLGIDSFVFLDDNPVERAQVSNELPMVAVPDVGSNIATYIAGLDQGHYFETLRLSEDDFKRKQFYVDNLKRNDFRADFTDYSDFLKSLSMRAEIAPFSPVYLDRIHQLINKTNQFNLTTRRFSRPEVEVFAGASHNISLYARLSDKFGDNGLVSVLMASVSAAVARIDVWLMSCRVLKRNLEHAVFDALVAECRTRGITSIEGYYVPTDRNGLVSEHYTQLGFTEIQSDEKTRRFVYPLTNSAYEQKNNVIEVMYGTH